MIFKLIEEVIQYNANPNAKNENDCTIRALSLAYDMQYTSVKNELNALSRHSTAKESKFNTIDTIEAFIAKHGFNSSYDNEHGTDISIDDVEDFARQNSHGTYIIFCTNRIKQSNSYHLVTIIDGKIYDTWDSSSYYVKKAWQVKAPGSLNFRFEISDYDDYIYSLVPGADIKRLSNTSLKIILGDRKFNISIPKRDITKPIEDIQNILKKQVESKLK